MTNYPSRFWLRRAREDDDPSPVQYEAAIREGDRRFVRALAQAIVRGDHLPQAMRKAA